MKKGIGTGIANIPVLDALFYKDVQVNPIGLPLI
ncbi:hypothetical protein PALA111701_08115 [Paenibacillus lactis]|jgi:hypothetical protein|uniref:Uncharacterized protein n=1 Tax=Paenibacillus lactis TaxID=228574 RepID=A0ABS4F5Q2_9BACL|nr:hypothetical protein [Paenibacillus lactis]